MMIILVIRLLLRKEWVMLWESNVWIQIIIEQSPSEHNDPYLTKPDYLIQKE